MENRDFSPLLPLTWRDLIYLRAFARRRDKIEASRRLVWEDMRFLIYRLSASFTGDKGMNFLPSAVAAQEARLFGDE